VIGAMTLAEQTIAIRREMDLDLLRRTISELQFQPASVEVAVLAIQKASSLLQQRKHLHKSIVAAFSTRFPDLVALVPDYETYARAALFLATSSDPSLTPDLVDLLTQQQFVALNLGLSTSLGPEITDAAFADACQLQIDSSCASRELSSIAASAVSQVAPNVCSLVGPDLAAMLISFCNGLGALSQIPACNLKAVGAKKSALLGFSSRSSDNHRGILYHCDLVREAPPEFRDAVFRDLVNKVSLVSRVDVSSQYQEGSYGQRTRDEIIARLDKKTNNNTPKVVRPLPIPGLEKRVNRGGRQKRANKKKFGMGEELKRRSRVAFGIGGQFDDFGQQFGAAALEGFRKRKAAVDAPFQKKIDSKLKNLS
jgi:U4/U6 small nuclear ribonucleoprotein PRP31